LHDTSLQQAGAQNSQSPVDAKDEPAISRRLLESLFDITHFQK